MLYRCQSFGPVSKVPSPSQTGQVARKSKFAFVVGNITSPVTSLTNCSPLLVSFMSSAIEFPSGLHRLRRTNLLSDSIFGKDAAAVSRKSLVHFCIIDDVASLDSEDRSLIASFVRMIEFLPQSGR